ncbi:hypothetical protein KJ885_01500 [Patescibacteria group bacterium]|nr:hypothetical protein [Patescibacteria group bacterium]
MVDADKKIENVIREGSVFYFADDAFFNEKPHYYVVLNHNPLKDIILILVYASSFDSDIYLSIEDSPFPNETYIDVTPQECSIFNRVSIFDCNRVFERNIDIFIEKFRSRKLKSYGYIEKNILVRLRDAVLKSPAVAERIKKLLE